MTTSGIRLLLLAVIHLQIAAGSMFQLAPRQGHQGGIFQDEIIFHYQYGEHNGNSSCPPWFLQVPNSTACRCSLNIDRQIICSSRDSLPRKLYIMIGYCMTWQESLNEPVLARCPFHYFNYDKTIDGYLPLDPELRGENLTERMCSNFNRLGSLCSTCKPEYGPAPFSIGMKCGKCEESYRWLYYLLFQFFLLTVMFILCAVFMVEVTKSPLNALVFYWQIFVVTLNFDALLYGFLSYYIKIAYIKVVLSFYAVWNLEFFRYFIPPLCVTSSMNNINALMFDYIVALYPILLTAVAYIGIDLYDRKVRVAVCLWMPFKRCFTCCKKKWNPKASIVKTFATFLMLSYTKLIFTSANLLYSTPVYDHDGKSVPPYTVLYYDSKIAYFSKEHAPYVVIGCTVLILTALPPCLLLLYPTGTFKKLLEKCGFRQWPMLHIFMDTFQGWYKDGTEGRKDYRWVSALYLLFRFAFLGLYSATTVARNTSQLLWVVPGIVFTITALFFTIAQPYKLKWMNSLDGVIMGLLGMLFFTFYQYFDDLVFHIIMVISNMPLFLCILYASHQLANHYNIYIYLQNKLKCLLKKRNSCENEANLQDNLPYRMIHPNSYEESATKLPAELEGMDSLSRPFNTYGIYGSTGSTEQH